VKYALTTLAALSFGSLSFRISHMLGWNQFRGAIVCFRRRSGGSGFYLRAVVGVRPQVSKRSQRNP